MIQGKTAAEKADFIVSFAKGNKWAGSVKHGDESTTVVLTRGKEAVEIRYDGNSCKEMPIVTFDGQVRQVRNVAAALRVIGSSAKANSEVFADRADKKAAMRKAAPVKRAPGVRARKIPFTADEPVEDVKAKLLGRRIIWTNRISGLMEEDVVAPERNRNGLFAIAKGQLSFVGNYGFRSVRLDQLVAVR